MLKRIHVNQHVIRANQRTGARDAPLSVKTYRTNVRCHGVEVLGPVEVLYRPDEPLTCGARVWIETRSEVRPLGVDGRPLNLAAPANQS
jgi:hypothetical protein